MLIRRRIAFCSCRYLSKRAPSILVADMLGNFEVQSQSKVHAQLRRFVPENTLPEMRLPSVYGGEYLTNSLLAASRIIGPSKYHQPSSLSVEFMRAGSYDSPLEFSVTKMHETHRFMQCNVFVKQNDKCLSLANVSFHYEKPGPDSLSFDPTFPETVPGPEEVPFADITLEQIKSNCSNMNLPLSHFPLLLAKSLGLQVKPVDKNRFLAMNTKPVSQSRVWVRANPEGIEAALPSLGEFWSPGILAYMSDLFPIFPALRQQPSFRVGKVVSLNQSMWFLANRNLATPTEWVLMDLRLVHSGSNLTLCECYMWSEDKKRLLAISKQQGLVRPESKKSGKPE